LSEKGWRLLKGILLIGSVIAAIKLIFVDYTMDEEYQIVMAYRRLQGDALFGTMWEPHQTSTFGCVLLMKPFLAVTGGTAGIVVYLRICTALIQALLALWLYRVLCRMTEKRYAFLLSLFYMNFVPKLIGIPEFSNLQMWFFTVIVLALAEYCCGRKSRCWLVLAGVGMSLEVLSYPACLILFPFFMICIFIRVGKSRRWIDCGLFAGTCLICGALWLWNLFSEVTPEEFLRNLQLIVKYDATHDLALTAGENSPALQNQLVETILLLVLAFLAGFLVYWVWLKRRRRKSREPVTFERPVYAVFVLAAAEAVQLFYWIVLQSGYERPQIVVPVLLILSVLVWCDADSRKQNMLECMIGTVLVICAVLYMSDLGILNALAHGGLGVLAGTLVLVYGLESRRKSGINLSILVLCSLCFVYMFGKGFTVKMGRTETNTVLGIQNMIREGPAKGILTNYMLAYIIDSTYEEFESWVEEGTKCLIVTNMVNTAGTSPYLFQKDLEICHFSVVDPTTYDEKLLNYWELYPEKKPDVIVVDCWYGGLMEKADSWIMEYIENEFGYSEMIDGKYVRFYKR